MLKAFWYSKPKMGRGDVINFGDELSPIILEKIAQKNIEWTNPLKQNFFERNFTKHVLGIGSILHFGAKNSLIWGSGLIEKKSKAPSAKYFAVRGKYTRKELISRGLRVPEVYGDPGLLTSKYFNFSNKSKNYKVGIIPHYVEFDEINQWFYENNFSSEFKMIDLRNPVNEVLNDINQCELIVSSSLHGVIVPQSYGIPTLRVVFSNKIIGDGIKYADYFDSVGIQEYEANLLNKKNFNDIVLKDLFTTYSKYLNIKLDLVNIQDNLLNNKPF